MSDPAVQTPIEEIANGTIHGMGAALSLAGLIVLVTQALPTADLGAIAAAAIYGSSLITLYLASALYHLIRHERVKSVFECLDHAAIFLLIAGTYTPFALLSLRGTTGYLLLAAIWLLAIGGILFKLLSPHRFHRRTVFLYVGMGWLGLFAVDRLLQTTPAEGLLLLLAGGLAYTGGLAFYLWERLPFNHAIWHLFVLKGSVLHFCAVVFYVLPLADAASRAH